MLPVMHVGTWIFLLAATALPNGVAPAVETVDRVEYYDVHGGTAQALAEQMAARGPAHPSGRRAWGFTAWEVRTRYALEPVPGGCRLAVPAATITIVTTLPRWQPDGPARWHLRADWRRMSLRLREHEDVHREHALTAARSAVAGLAALPLQPDCRVAERQAGSILRDEVTKARKASMAFDRDTDFGAHEGVHLRR